MTFFRFLALTCLFLCFSFTGFSQDVQELHHRARIYFDNTEQESVLESLGIEMDHGLVKKGVFIESDYSLTELKLIKEAGFQYDIIISDVAKHYVQQSDKPLSNFGNKNASCTSTSAYPTPANFNLGSMGGYFTYEEINAQLDLMESLYPNLVKAKSPISTFQTYENRPIQWLKISDNADIDESEPEIMYSAIHHAREPASVSTLLFYMWYLLENYDADPEIKAIVDNTELYFVPLVNPDGYIYNQTTNPNGGGLWRKNRRNHGGGSYGVDNNRNYGIQWGTTGTSTTNTNSETYCGTAPFSEPENQAMKWFCENHDFVMAFNNHTYSNLLLYPFGYEVNEPTPDDALFEQISEEMVSQNGYINQLSADLYPASGDSDDWMYVATADKPKILAFTPEIGSSFWPSQAEIIPLCNETMYMNLTAAHMVSKYAKVEDLSGPVVETISGSMDIDVQRMGLDGGTFIIELLPGNASTPIESTSPPQTINLDLLEGQTVTVSFTLDPTTSIGTALDFDLQVDNGDYTQVIPLSKTYGAQNSIFADNASDLSNWNNVGWSITSSEFYSSPSSITESPGGNYTANQDKTITLIDGLDLSTSLSANLSFYAKWEIETNWDYLQVEVSTDDGVNWIPQCGHYTNNGEGSFQPNNEPLYDGIQASWVNENIDLSDYLGQIIKIRFHFVSDGFVHEDGFYFDEVNVSTIEPSSGGLVLNAKAMLQGAYVEGSNLMTDILRSNDLLPLLEPYTTFGYSHTGSGGQSTNTGVLSITGDNAIVDWIIVELRDAAMPASVIASKSALIQRDGDIVSLDGVSALSFNELNVSEVLVALKHRNHFGVRNTTGISSEGNQSLDFTDPTLSVFGNEPMVLIEGKNMLFAADANGDGAVNASDKNNFWQVENGGPFDYMGSKSDFNLDGVINSVDKNTLWRGNNSTKTEQLD